MKVKLSSQSLSPWERGAVSAAQQALADSLAATPDLQSLLQGLSQVSTWTFEELASLSVWVPVLDRLDVALDSALKDAPSLVLARVPNQLQHDDTAGTKTKAELLSLEQLRVEPPVETSSTVEVILKFTAVLLSNAREKVFYNSVEHLTALLGARSDTIATLALACLHALMTPAPPRSELHDDQAEFAPGMEALYGCPELPTALLHLAHGWGSRGQGLGLLQCLTAPSGQLPRHIGHLRFEYLAASPPPPGPTPGSGLAPIPVLEEQTTAMIRATDLCNSPGSTADLFLQLAQEAGPRFPHHYRFALLAQIRQVRGWRDHDTRRAFLTNRLRALSALLYFDDKGTVPYLASRLELVLELIDLVRQSEDSRSVPMELRLLALHCLNAIVISKANGSGVIGRVTNITNELGATRGRYTGLLPSLVRNVACMLQALPPPSASAPPAERGAGSSGSTGPAAMDEDDPSLMLGLAFVEATSVGPGGRAGGASEAEELAFAEVVLMLADSTATQKTTAAAALTECGLLGALLGAAQAHATTPLGPGGGTALPAPRNYIIAQAVRFLSNMLDCHSSCVTVFRDMNAAEALVNILHREILRLETTASPADALAKKGGPEPPKEKGKGKGKAKAEESWTSKKKVLQRPTPSQQSLLHSIVVCLYGAFNQQVMPVTLLRGAEFTQSVIMIFEHTQLFPNHTIATVMNLLCEMINQDPQSVGYVHSSGIARAFLQLLEEPSAKIVRLEDAAAAGPTVLPAHPHLIAICPSLLSALALTAAGAEKVRQANPFPALAALLHDPRYCVPTHCLLASSSQALGSGLDELMRHVPSLRPQCLQAMVEGLKRISFLGQSAKLKGDNSPEYLHFLQYITCAAKTFTPILSKSDHTGVFIKSGGLEALLEVYPVLLGSGRGFLAHAACMSTNEALAHFPAGAAVNKALMTLAAQEPTQVLKRVLSELTAVFACLSEAQKDLRFLHAPMRKGSAASRKESVCSRASSVGSLDDMDVDSPLQESSGQGDDSPPVLRRSKKKKKGKRGGMPTPDMNLAGILDCVPAEALHIHCPDPEEPLPELLDAYVKFLHQVSMVEWLTGLIATLLKAAHSRSSASTSTWGQDLSTGPGRSAFRWLLALFGSSQLEMGRFGTTSRAPVNPQVWKLRIVHQEGAMVRNGIEIDTSDSTYQYVMGTEVEATDRKITTDKLVRYKTELGWISEHMRGTGKEPISEVLDMFDRESLEGAEEKKEGPIQESKSEGGVDKMEGGRDEEKGNEDGNENEDVPTARAPGPKRQVWQLRGTGGALLRRMNGSILRVLAVLGKIVLSGERRFGAGEDMALRQLAPHSLPFLEGVAKTLGQGFRTAVTRCEQQDAAEFDQQDTENYMHTLLHSAEAILMDERRQTLNTFCLYQMDKRGNLDDLLRICGEVLMNVLDPSRKQSKRLYSSLFVPHVLNLIKLLATRSAVLTSPYTRAMVHGNEKIKDFEPAQFARKLHIAVAQMLMPVWESKKLSALSTNRDLELLLQVVSSLMDSLHLDCQSDQDSRHPSRFRVDSSGDRSWSDLPPFWSGSGRGRGRGMAGPPGSAGRRGFPFPLPPGMEIDFAAALGARMPGATSAPFEPDENTITQLQEMGFGRAHILEALRATETNRVEVAMEYLLNHPPSYGAVDTEEPPPAPTQPDLDSEHVEGSSATAAPPDEPATPAAPPPAGASEETSEMEVDGDTPLGVSEAQTPVPRGTTSSVQATEGEPTSTPVPPTPLQPHAPGTDRPSAAAASASGTQSDAQDSNVTPAPSGPVQTPQAPVRVDASALDRIMNTILGSASNAQQTPQQEMEEGDDQQEGKGKPDEEKKASGVEDAQITQDIKAAEELLNRYLENLTDVCAGIVGCFGQKKTEKKEKTKDADEKAAKESNVDASINFLIAEFLFDRSRKMLEKEKKGNKDEKGEKDEKENKQQYADEVAKRVLLRTREAALPNPPLPEFTPLCHLLVVVLKSSVAVRKLLVQSGTAENELYKRILQLIETLEDSKTENEDTCTNSDYFLPCLLLIDLLMQPILKETKKEPAESEAKSGEEESKGEVKEEKGDKGLPQEDSLEGQPDHQAESKDSKSSSSSVHDADKKKKEKDDEKAAKKAEAKKKILESMKGIPIYHAVIPPEDGASILDSVLSILHSRPKLPLSPSMAHALLQLLARLVRSHDLALRFVCAGGLDLLLDLSSTSAFKGGASLLTVILRHVLEDPHSLQMAMETEIRSIFHSLSKQQNQQSRTSINGAPPRIEVRLNVLVGKLGPLILRDAATFLKAIGNVLIVSPDGDSSDVFGGRSGSRAAVSLRNPADKGAASSSETPRVSARRHSLARPSSLVTSLVTKFLKKYLDDEGRSANADGAVAKPDQTGALEFLTTAELLDVLADLVMAFPACATAIHRYHLHVEEQTLKNLAHAIPGCCKPSPTLAAFLLHRVLPRICSAKKGVDSPTADGKKEASNRAGLLVVQKAGRLLTALCARPGEGRRRVIGEIAAALRCLPEQDSMANPLGQPYFWVLEAWAELVHALINPQASAGSSSSVPSAPSLEMVRLMVDSAQMGEALTLAMGRLDLSHPWAVDCVPAFLRPLEHLTRPTVVESLRKLRKKHKPQSMPPPQLGSPRARVSSDNSRGTSTVTPRSESFHDNTMIDEGFQSSGGARNVEISLEDIVQDMVHGDMDADEDNAGEDDVEVTVYSQSESSDSDDSDDDDDEDEDEDEDDDDENRGGGRDSVAMEVVLDNEEEAHHSNGTISFEEEEEEEEDEDLEVDEEDDNEAVVFEGVIDARDFSMQNPMYSGIPTYSDIQLIDEDGEEADISVGGPSEFFSEMETLAHQEHLLHRLMDFTTGAPRPGQRAESLLSELLSSEGLQHSFVMNGPPRGLATRNFMMVGGGGPSLTAPTNASERMMLERMAQHAHRRAAGASREPALSSATVRLFPAGGAASSHELTPPTPHPLLAGAPVATDEERSSSTGSFFGLSRRHAMGSSGRFRISDTRGHLSDISDPNEDGAGASASAAEARWTDDGVLPPSLSSSMAAVGSTLCEFLDQVPAPTPETEPPQVAPPEAPSQAKEEVEGDKTQEAKPEDEAKQVPCPDPEAAAEAKDGMAPSPETGVTDLGKQSPSSEGETMANLVSPLTLSAAKATPQETPAPSEAKGEEKVSTNGTPESEQKLDEARDGVEAAKKETPATGMSEEAAPALAATPPPPAATSEDMELMPVEQTSQADEAKPQHMETQDAPPQTGAIDTPAEGGAEETKQGDDGGSSTQEEKKEEEGGATAGGESSNEACPPGTDPEVWACLPEEMREELWAQHRQLEAQATDLVEGSGLDPEALAALPESLRQEVLEQEARERRMREEAAEAPANPANAQEMDNASFVASLAPDLRREILTTADENFLRSLPPDLVAEATLLRERASRLFRGGVYQSSGGGGSRAVLSRAAETMDLAEPPGGGGAHTMARSQGLAGEFSWQTANRYRGRNGPRRYHAGPTRARPNTITLELQHEEPECCRLAGTTVQSVLSLSYARGFRGQRLAHRFLLNLVSCRKPFRRAVLHALVALLASDPQAAQRAVATLAEAGTGAPMTMGGPRRVADFPPTQLLGTAVVHTSTRAKYAHTVLPPESGNSAELNHNVVRRLLDMLWFLTKQSAHVQYDLLTQDTESVDDKMKREEDSSSRSQLEDLLGLLGLPLYQQSAPCLDLLLNVLESSVQPLVNFVTTSAKPKVEKEEEKEEGVQQETKMEVEDAADEKKEEKESEESKKEAKPDKPANDKPQDKDIPTPIVEDEILYQLCTSLRLEVCSDTGAARVGSIVLALARVEANRQRLLKALATVGRELGQSAVQELRTLHANLQAAIQLSREQAESEAHQSAQGGGSSAHLMRARLPPSALSLPPSSSEPRLLRVLQLLTKLSVDGCGLEGASAGAQNREVEALRDEIEAVVSGLGLEVLWESLGQCLEVVSVLEGVQEEESSDPQLNLTGTSAKNTASVAGLLARFLPSVEAFFTVNARERKAKLKTAGGDKMPEDGDEGKDGDEEKKEDKDTASKKTISKIPEGPRTSRRNSEEILANSAPEIQLLVAFVRKHKALLNVLLRQNPSLLERSLEVLVREPGCRAALDFDNKRAYFRAQLRRLRQTAARRHGTLRLSVRRNQVFEDSFHQLRMRTTEELRGRLSITFQGEEGIDAGGVTREWYSVLAREIFNANYVLFIAAADGATFQPNPNSHYNPDHLAYFKFVGRILGKAIADGQLLDAHFTRSFYKHILKVSITHHDMEAIDPDYYKNLLQILEFPLEALGLELTFSTETSIFGKMETVDLIENGRNIAVVDENKMEYVTLITKHRMQTAIQQQIDAFLEGFHELVPADLISIFSPKELELLISGLPDINVNDLQQNTDYVHYKANDPQIQWFWNVLRSFSQEEKALFLQFVTGSSKVPLEGFSMLQGMRGIQKFSIHRAYGGSKLLPASHTCFNQLDLPEYSSEEETREKLLIALREGAEGFGFG